MPACGEYAVLVQGFGVTLRDGERSFTLRIDDLRIRPGEAMGLTGASGSGKTLLLELLGLLREPYPGGGYSVNLETGDAVDLAACWRSRAGRRDLATLRGRLFGFIPQTGGLLPFLNVQQNVVLSQRINDISDPAHVQTLMTRLGLQSIARLTPAKLSIGQRQRVSIARALAHHPRFLIADEPTAALDPGNSAQAMALLFEVARDTGCAVIISSHDHDLLDGFSLRRHVLEPEPGHPRDHVVSRIRPATGVAA
jgi:putative ABC transport system ATP-binding protein